MQKLVSIKIDAELIKEIMTITGKKTKRAAVEGVLKEIVDSEKRWKPLEELRGIGWGWTDEPHRELDEMRTDKQ